MSATDSAARSFLFEIASLFCVHVAVTSGASKEVANNNDTTSEGTITDETISVDPNGDSSTIQIRSINTFSDFIVFLLKIPTQNF